MRTLIAALALALAAGCHAPRELARVCEGTYQ